MYTDCAYWSSIDFLCHTALRNLPTCFRVTLLNYKVDGLIVCWSSTTNILFFNCLWKTLIKFDSSEYLVSLNEPCSLKNMLLLKWKRFLFFFNQRAPVMGKRATCCKSQVWLQIPCKWAHVPTKNMFLMWSQWDKPLYIYCI